LFTLCGQGRSPSSICPRCHITVETTDHVLKCSHLEAVNDRSQLLASTIQALRIAHTPQIILNTLHYKLSLLLDLPLPLFTFIPSITTLPQCLLKAIRHQNILGWHLMICGYTSKFWAQACCELFDHSISSPTTNWDIILVNNMVQLLKGIWSDCNVSFHGKSREEHQTKLRQRILDQVRLPYKNPPKLEKRYPKIQALSLKERLSKPTSYLIHWLSRVPHQQSVTETI
jgi:hypothetical protein